MDENEQLRLILPLLRPRSAEATWYSILLTVLLSTGILGLVAFYFTRRYRHRSRQVRQFLHRAKELGLKRVQIDLLGKIIHQSRMNNPPILFDSVTIFDQVAGSFADKTAAQDLNDPSLEILATVRKHLGFDRVPPDHPLPSTRQIEAGQTLHFASPSDGETHTWVMVEHREGALIAAPLLTEDRELTHRYRVGEVFEIHFWRDEGIEYHFSTSILLNPSNSPQIYLRHTNDLRHVQQRSFFRLKTDIPLLLFGITQPPSPDDTDAPIPPANAPRLSGKISDISGGGIGFVAADKIPATPYFLIDPAFSGEFPLAGLLCRLVRQTSSPQGPLLQLKFLDLPANRESRLVRQIQQHQLAARGKDQDSSTTSS
jgi:c-di-GMP-binding flagellar brake protein YcgR